MEAVYLKTFVAEVGYLKLAEVILYCKIKGALTLSKNPAFHCRTKHRYQTPFYQRSDEKRKFKAEYMGTEEMSSETLTKGISESRMTNDLSKTGLLNLFGGYRICTISSHFEGDCLPSLHTVQLLRISSFRLLLFPSNISSKFVLGKVGNKNSGTAMNEFLKVCANQTFVDLTKCKVTHVGNEYVGRISITEFNYSCQYWSSSTEKGAKELADVLFPDGSKNLARNYCRNPNLADSGPWCYTNNKKQIKDSCEIPFCKIMNCRITGPGMEYTGSIAKSATGRKCKKWKKSHELKEKKKESTFKNRFFPEGSVTEAGNKCRNPNGNVSGPWCYVEKEDSKLQGIEFCDVPFCDDIDPVTYSEGGSKGRYFFFTSFNETQSLKLDFRLWDERDWLGGKIYILLSSIDIFGNRSDIKRWDSAIEIMISNTGSGIISSEDSELQNTQGILSAINWTSLEIVWVYVGDDVMLIQVFEGGKIRPFLLAEVDVKNKLLGEAPFRYFSLSGSPSLWNVSSSEEVPEIELKSSRCFDLRWGQLARKLSAKCPIHTSPVMEFSRYYLMKKTSLGIDVEIAIRAARQAVLLLRVAPMMETHQVQIVIGDGDKVKVAYFGEDKAGVVLKETVWPKILDLWKWENFKISLLKDRLQIFWDRSTGIELLMDVTHSRLAGLMWIAFGSPFVSYWALYCDPKGNADPPPPSPPECISSENDDFNGTQSFTSSGHQCIPWIDDIAIPQEYQKAELFERYGGKSSCQNFCRNLDKDPRGPFCIVKDPKTNKYGKENCYPRPCHLGECKLAGTANDYTGHLNQTRSKRDCKNWIDFVDDPVVNINNFPDPSLEDAANYCRNPSKTVGGPWCFTADPQVPRDFCYVRDCDKLLECTIISSGFRLGHLLYIMPRWRKYGLHFWLKTWNPDIYEGLKIKLIGLNGEESYDLLIGDENNEKLKFFFVDPDGNEILLLQKTLLHLIPAGKWGGFWLRTDEGKVELGYSGVEKPFFEWTSTKKELSFDPAFIDFGTIQDHWIGVNFLCTECLLERTTSSISNRIYPINLWKNIPSKSALSDLVLHLRGMASVAIILMSNPDFDEYMSVKLSSNGEKISIWEYRWNYSNRKLVEYDSVSSFSPNHWTEYEFSFQERSISLKQDKGVVFTWESRQYLLFYWFSIQVQEGYVVWAANCPPGDIDGPPRNGQWSPWGPWSCSVSCGGGQGRTLRECNNPAPNIFGRECKGSPIYDGPCNTFPCGEISPGTNDLIRHHLSSQSVSVEVEAGSKVVLPCNNEARGLIMNEVKKMNVTWTLNGFPFSRRRARIDHDYSLVIPKVNEQDNGVYLCIAYQDPGRVPSKVIIEVISLVVNRTFPTKKIRKGRSLSVKCNGIALSYVYGDLSQRWEINGAVWKDYGITTLETVNTDKIENVTDSHDGIWICVIVQQDLGFKWKTNWMYIKVRSAPNFWTHLTEDAATAPLFGHLGSETMVKIVFFVLLLVILCVTVIPSALIIRYLRRKQK